MKRRVVLPGAAICLGVALACGEGEPDADLVVSGATLLPAPSAAPIPDATLVIRDGRVAEIRRGADPRAEKVVDGTGRFVTAGFWNSHVHFTGPQWSDAANEAAGELQAGLEQMLVRYGFTTVVDTGSDLPNTVALRARIESGELRGPRISTTGTGFVPQDGSPAYLEIRLPELDSPETAARLVTEAIENGAEAIKLFTGTFLAVGETALMPADVVTAAVGAAHARGKLVIAHPQSEAGVRAALAGGVDILAHTAPGEGPWPDSLVEELIAREMVLVPTLSLWRFELSRQEPAVPMLIIERFEQDALAQLRSFTERDGRVLFGTDVGYMDRYDPTEEYRLLGEAGMSTDEILASLTTNPASVWGDSSRGTVRARSPADLVLLEGDPHADVRNFARVDTVIRDGRILFRKDVD